MKAEVRRHSEPGKSRLGTGRCFLLPRVFHQKQEAAGIAILEGERTRVNALEKNRGESSDVGEKEETRTAARSLGGGQLQGWRVLKLPDDERATSGEYKSSTQMSLFHRY